MLVHAATDGETYGHHKKFTDLGLGYALFVEAEKRSLDVTNYAAYLATNPATREVIIVGGEGSSWSCAHGVGRWARDCGCSTGGEAGWNQRWRTPLRAALDVVRDAADAAFDRLGGELFGDPWAARDDYVQVVIGAERVDDFIAARAARPMDDAMRGSSLASPIRVSANTTWYLGGRPGLPGSKRPDPTSNLPTPWYLNGSCWAGS